MKTNHTITISVTRSLQVELQLFLVLLAVNAAVWLAGNNFGLIPIMGGTSRMLTFDNEWNVPTWFNFLLVVQASLLCLLSHRRDSAENFWRVLAVVFLVLSVDELFSFHERLIEPLRILIGPPAFFTLRGSFREHCWC